MDNVVDAYANWLRSWGASDNTITGRTAVANVILRDYGLDGITTANLQSYLGRPVLSRWSRATYFSNLKCFCTWLYASGLIESNPVLDLKSPTRPKSLPRPLSEAEVELVLGSADQRMHDWIELALLAGLRAHEIAKIAGQDVTPDGIYVEGKGGTRSTIPVHPAIWAMAQRYPRTGYWFPGRSKGKHIARQTITTQVGLHFRENGVSGSIHRARHVYGTRLLRAGVNIRTVQQLMRHASLQTTAIYTAVDENELRAAIHLLSA